MEMESYNNQGADVTSIFILLFVSIDDSILHHPRA